MALKDYLYVNNKPLSLFYFIYILKKKQIIESLSKFGFSLKKSRLGSGDRLKFLNFLPLILLFWH